MDSKKRTLAKTAVYRGSITVLLFTLLWISTNNIYETSVITIIFNVLATIIYYFHERMWGKIKWGNVEHSKLLNQNNNLQ
ncbi:MAG: DUF2061 domain-containing protein [Nitrosarchaeum sp.]|jgi:uncharacterized membrane protein|uniref:DUF2061 domain-containing protein n=1 Tax=Nitrosarchaeum sp. TaxID=2026886 RepID=UPI002DF1A017|nr:DUF2061 domain-containing protein [Nitrosarchaeum sp.]